MQKSTETKRMPTLADVALEAGVNKISVSVVLNGARSSTRVSAATRAKILEAAARLQYQPNASARSLALGRTDTVGVLFGGLPVASSTSQEIYGASILQGITDECGRRDFDIMLFTKSWAFLTPAQITRFRDRRVDGIVVVAPDINSRAIESLIEMGVRTIAVTYPAPKGEWDSVDVDNYAGARLAVEHLIDLGHRRIAHLMGDPALISAHERLTGYRNALRDAGIPFFPELLIEGVDGQFTEGIEGSCSGVRSAEDTRRLLRLPDPPTAIFACNDLMASEALRGAQSVGVEVPRGLSIIGFDDRPFVSLLDPPLTTIRQPMIRIGAMAASLLIDRIVHETRSKNDQASLNNEENAHSTVGNIRVQPELVVRGSTTNAPTG